MSLHSLLLVSNIAIYFEVDVRSVSIHGPSEPRFVEERGSIVACMLSPLCPHPRTDHLGFERYAHSKASTSNKIS